jgi:hypothetical protein
MNETTGTGYAIVCAGTADFIRDFGMDLAGVLKDLFGQDALGADDIPDPSLLGSEVGPRADLATTLLVGFITLVPSWMAKKFLDEVYEVTLQPRLRRWLSAADQRAIGGSRDHEKTFIVSTWYEDLGVIVIVAIQDSTFSEVAAESDRILALHRFGLEWANSHHHAAPVQMYLVSHGKVDVEPRLFGTVVEAEASLRA